MEVYKNENALLLIKYHIQKRNLLSWFIYVYDFDIEAFLMSYPLDFYF